MARNLQALKTISILGSVLPLLSCVDGLYIFKFPGRGHFRKDSQMEVDSDEAALR